MSVPISVPIIGQPQVTDWSLVIQVRCPCGHVMLLVGKPGIIVPCECERIYRLNGVPSITPAGEFNLPLAFGVKQPAIKVEKP